MSSLASEELQPGTLLNGRYKIVRPLGRGGMGTVYLAEHTRLDTRVAVKEIRGSFADDAAYRDALQQCEKEARLLVRLRHANLPIVNDAFIENDRFYLIMEFIEGMTLEALLSERRGQPLPVANVIEWGLQIADVLAYLHSLDPPLIFRDLKPSNVMLTPDGSVRLIDFGIARKFQPGASKDTALLGSVGYSPPEQFGRNQTEPRSDIYALGATLHHLLTGRDPSGTPFKFAPVNTLNPFVSETLSQLIADCLELDAEKRPPGVHAVAMRLLAARDELPMQGEPDAIAAMGNIAPNPNTVPGKSSNPLLVPDTIRTPILSDSLPRPSGSAAIQTSQPSEKASSNLVTVLIGTLAGLVFVALLVGATHFLKPKKAHKPEVGSPEIVNAPVVAPPVQTETPKPIAAPSAQNDDPMPPPASNPDVEFTKIESPGLVPDAAAGFLLQINVAGTIHSQTGKSGVVAAFFYDADDNPLPANDQNQDKRFLNSDGQLSVAASVSPTGNNTPFAVSLYIPVSQFPASAMEVRLKVRSLVFFDGKRLAKSDPYTLPFLLHPVAAERQVPVGHQAPPPAGTSGLHL